MLRVTYITYIFSAESGLFENFLQCFEFVFTTVVEKIRLEALLEKQRDRGGFAG
jgi:hypothetical protein